MINVTNLLSEIESLKKELMETKDKAAKSRETARASKDSATRFSNLLDQRDAQIATMQRLLRHYHNNETNLDLRQSIERVL